MNSLLTATTGLALVALLASCGASRQPPVSHLPGPVDRPTALGGQTSTSTVSGEAQTRNGITLTPFDDSPRFPSAQMRVLNPINGSGVPSGTVGFDYELTNFELTKMTGSDHAAHMANSMKGQHIHLIVDDQPYIAKYETHFQQPIADGQHVVLSFLSRSYHESLKQQGAYDLRLLTVGKLAENTPPMSFDLKAPALFYSRPKDTYAGADAKQIMLDFYLVNTTLSPGGNQVRATINGTPFMLSRWLPYMMEGLPAGQATIQLELLDSRGNLIPGPYNSVTRTITVQP